MDSVQHPFMLRVVPAADIYPHEHVDPNRVARLAARLEQDDVLKNPPLVLQAGERYILLDGATRTTALQELGYDHSIVQVITDRSDLELQTWYHGVAGLRENQLIELLRGLPELAAIDADGSVEEETLLSSEGICCIKLGSGTTLTTHPAREVTALQAINAIVAAYTRAGRVIRTMDNSMPHLLEQHPEAVALVTFPKYTVPQIVDIALKRQVLPAGITRFIVPGRVLRINADLSYLKSDDSLQAKNDWLQALVRQKQADHRIRYYAEPVYLFDE